MLAQPQDAPPAPSQTKRGVAVIRHMLPSPEHLSLALPEVPGCVECGTRVRPLVWRDWSPGILGGHFELPRCERCAAEWVLGGGGDSLSDWKALPRQRVPTHFVYYPRPPAR